jgi:putative ABC transport system permease protein
VRHLWRFVSLRRLVESPLRALLTLVGIAAGVSSLVATGAANEAILRGFRSTLDAVGGTADLVVTGPSVGGLPDELVEPMRAVAGVKSVSPAVMEVAKLADDTRVQVFGVDLAAGDDSRGMDAFASGEQMPDAVAFLNDPDAVLVAETLARERGLKVGDKLPMRTSDGLRDLHVRGVIQGGNAAKAFGGRVAVMDLYTAEAAFGRGAKVDRVDVSLLPGADRERVTAALREIVGVQGEVAKNEARTGPVERMLRSFQVGLFMGSTVSLMVGLFLVFNTVSFSVAQRRREIGTLRALGVSRAQVVAMFAGEAALYGALGGAGGLVLGRFLAKWAVKQALSSVNNAYLSVNVGEVAVSDALLWGALVTGVVGSIVAALVPALEAASVPPVDALRRDRTSRDQAPPTLLARLRGLGLALAGLPLLLLPTVGGAPVFGNLTLALIALGAALTASSAVELLHRVVKKPVERAFGAPGRVALAGLVRERRRSGVAAASVLIGISLVLCLGTFVESFRGAITTWIERAIPADLFVASGSRTIGLANTPLQEGLADEVAKVPGVAEAHKVRLVWSEALGLRIGIFALEWDLYSRRANPVLTAGEPDEVRHKLAAGALLVSDNLARKTGLRVGDKVPLKTPQGPREFEVAGFVVDYSSDQGILLFDRPVYVRTFGDGLIDSVDLFLAPGADPQRVRAEIEAKWGEKYDLRVSTNADLRRSVMDLIDDFFALVYVLLIISVAVGVLGVVGTLLAQVLDRTRELGILRASGASRGQVTGAVTLEAALLGLAGALLGLPTGLCLGAVFVHVVGVQATGWVFPLVTPWAIAFAAAAGSILFAAAGGLWPARRAASLDVVEAIGHE